MQATQYLMLMQVYRRCFVTGKIPAVGIRLANDLPGGSSTVTAVIPKFIGPLSILVHCSPTRRQLVQGRGGTEHLLCILLALEYFMVRVI